MLIKLEKNICELQFCRGTEGRCSFSLVDDVNLKNEIEQVLKNISLLQKNPVSEFEVQPHKRLKFALAACPNACTQPQIKDLGIIVRLFPSEIGAYCEGCGGCEDVCREQAVTIRNSRAQILTEQCLGCGMCISKCPYKTIESQGAVFQVIIGGRMGRHPAWAQELCVVKIDKLSSVIEYFFHKVIPMLSPDERVSELLKKLGLVELGNDMVFFRNHNRRLDGN